MGRLGLFALVSLVAISGSAQETPAPATAAAATAAPTDDAAREQFLLEAQVVRTRPTSKGVTLALRATLERNGFQHDAEIQTIDVQKQFEQMDGGSEIDFRDSYRNDVAAYRLDRLLGLGMVPVTVLRSYQGKPAAYTWWVDDVLMDEMEHLKKRVHAPNVLQWNRQVYEVRVFDQLIYNFDRSLENLLIDRDWRIWMIDHTRAFKIFKKVKNEKALGAECERHLLAALRGLDEPTLRASMKGLLSKNQVDALLARRDQIVAYYDAKIAELSEAAVLYDLPRPALKQLPQP
jgi:hypothetical protein